MGTDIVEASESQNLVESAGTMSIAAFERRVNAVRDIKRLMTDSVHYGVIPGCGDKPALFKSGAEWACTFFRLSPTFKFDLVELANGHREYTVTCTLTNIDTGQVWAQGLGLASTMESKYRYRGQGIACPECGAVAVTKSKYGRGGWFCFAKKGGCGKNWDDKNAFDMSQSQKVENPDIADVYNTVLKMGVKRSHVAATLSATGGSAEFTQDIEDFAQSSPQHAPWEAPAAAPEPPRQAEPEHTEAEHNFYYDKLTALRSRVNDCDSGECLDSVREDLRQLLGDIPGGLQVKMASTIQSIKEEGAAKRERFNSQHDTEPETETVPDSDIPY